MVSDSQMVITDNGTKQFYRQNMAKFFSNDIPERYYYMFQIIMRLINNSEINNLKEQLGEKYDQVMANVVKFTPLYEELSMMKDILKTFKDLKKDEEKEKESVVEKHVKRMLEKARYNMPQIHMALIKVYVLLINRCDLRNMTIPKSEIAIAGAGKLDYRMMRNLERSSFNRESDY